MGQVPTCFGAISGADNIDVGPDQSATRSSTQTSDGSNVSPLGDRAVAVWQLAGFSSPAFERLREAKGNTPAVWTQGNHGGDICGCVSAPVRAGNQISSIVGSLP